MSRNSPLDYPQLVWEFLRDRLLSQPLTSPPDRLRLLCTVPGSGTGAAGPRVQAVPFHAIEPRRRAGVFPALTATLATSGVNAQSSARPLTDQARRLEATATRGRPPGTCEHPMRQLKARRRLTWVFNTKKNCLKMSFPCLQECLPYSSPSQGERRFQARSASIRCRVTARSQ